MRLPEEHMSPQELASLADRAEARPELDAVREHLAQCQACRSLAEAHWTVLELARLARAAPTARAARIEEGCPPLGEWVDLADGLKTEKEAQALWAHVAMCAGCAETSREAMGVLRPAAAEGVEESMTGLASATAAWQRRMAAEMAAAAGGMVAGKAKVSAMPRRRGVWMPWAVAAVLLLAAVAAGGLVWTRMHPPDARLLALAYNRQRTLELRVPGGEPVAMASETRGGSGGELHGLTDTSELLELRLRAQKHLEATPNSPYWHQVMGEVNLLEKDGAAARRNFEIAQATDENLPNLQPDLAAAWFELAEKTGSAESYAQAAELYLRELHGAGIEKQPERAALLHYNLAQCWERQSLVENALDDLREALKLEQDAAWRKAIAAEIERLQNHAATTPTDGYETALEEATGKLLPLWETSAEARAKIAVTAQMGLRHQDGWLRDWMHARHTPASAEGDRRVAAAVELGGTPERALEEAQAAVKAYRLAGNAPGRIRAELAEVYALQRLGRDQECVAKAAELGSQRLAGEYSRIVIESRLDGAICLGRAGNLTAAQRAFEQAEERSAALELPLLRVRAVSMNASFLDFRGMTAAAWELDRKGQELCRSLGCPSVRLYQFLFNLVEGAERLRLWFAAAEVMRTATAVATATGDATEEAFALERLGILKGHTREFQEAEMDFDRAAELAQRQSRTPVPALFRADWQMDRAQLRTERGDSDGALRLLRGEQTVVLSSTYKLGRVHYFVETARAEAGARELGGAEVAARQAVAELEGWLAGMTKLHEREQWQREAAEAYNLLAQVCLARGENAEALEVWERFRRLPYDATEVRGPVVPAGGGAVVVLARLGERYVGWAFGRDGALQVRDLGGREQVQRLAQTFYRLCSDPHSDVADVRKVGRTLYGAILQPFAAELRAGTTLRMDPDASLGFVPFGALTDGEGRWLAQSLAITVLGPSWTAREQAGDGAAGRWRDSHLAAMDGFGKAASRRDEVAEIARLFPGAEELRPEMPAQTTQRLERAGVFHFSGHASMASGTHRLEGRDADGGAVSLDEQTIRTRHLSGCRLAVLAACNTSGANPDQVEPGGDMKGAFLAAGAQAVLASAWDVDDDSTHALMVPFYRGLLSEQGPAKSLQLAQQAVSTVPEWKHPYFWASFELFRNRNQEENP